MHTDLSQMRVSEAHADVQRILGLDGKADPSRDPGLDATLLRGLYEAMVRARVLDDRMVTLQRQGRVSFHVGCRGEEAAIIASAAALRADDWIFPCYRELAALLWRGYPLQQYVDNMFGNAEDVVRGRQMPDHVTGKRFAYASVSSPIGTQIMHAVGVAWAAKLRGEDLVAATFFGDGATSTPDFHCGLNFAGVYAAPVVFLCRNNGWAISVPREKQTAAPSIAAKAAAYGIQGVRCDGNDALAVYRTVRDAAERARRGEGPTLVELVTYRLGSHSTSDDASVYRTDKEVESWRRVDPLPRLQRYLEGLGLWSDAEELRSRDQIERELKHAIDAAEAKAAPTVATMFDDVYAERPWHLQEQYESCTASAVHTDALHGEGART